MRAIAYLPTYLPTYINTIGDKEVSAPDVQGQGTGAHTSKRGKAKDDAKIEIVQQCAVGSLEGSGQRPRHLYVWR